VGQSRAETAFLQEFALGTAPSTGVAPIDASYYLPYNRVIARGSSGSCTPSPSWDPAVRAALIDDALSWPTANGGPIFWRQAGGFTGTNGTCGFTPQDEDGLMDAFKDRARFGLMTFDTMPNWNDGGTKRVGIGMDPGSRDANYVSGIQDTWSYYPNWMSDFTGVPTGAGTGNPGGCTLDGAAMLWENGARNPAAPPWEGRLMTFGDPAANTADIVAWNERVQQALLAIRPYGQTPIAAMLQDAKHFLLSDNNSIDPYIGGTLDPNFKTQLGDGCRKRKVILFTDGGPNWDLRPDCDYKVGEVDGKCPYPKAQDIAQDLAENNIPVYVIGLSVSTGEQTCTQMLTADPLACTTLLPCDSSCPALKCAYGYCVNNALQEALSQCCVIKTIAEKGGTTKAHFVENQGELFTAFGDILKTAVSLNKSRTIPVSAGLSQASNAVKNPDDPTLVGARFFSSFQDIDYDLRAGTIERQRYSCLQGGTQPSSAMDIDTTRGDKFELALNSDGVRPLRKVYTVVGEPLSDKILSERSIRPWYKPPSGLGDRLGAYGVIANSNADSKMISGNAAQISSTDLVDARAIMGATKTCGASGCCFPTPSQQAPSRADCRNRFLSEEFGLKVSNPDVIFRRKSAMGAVERSTPILVAPPSEVVGDTTYAAYRSGFGLRGTVMYAATVDGQLHAFDVWKLNTDNAELWTFMPPAVLSLLDRQFQDRFKATPQRLLDGPLTVRDVAGTPIDTTTGWFLTRTAADAKFGTNTRWYSILVGSFGAYGGYYALDVSWPNPDSTASPPTGYHKGPRFLWQLTTDINGAPVFGDRAGVPSIATLYFAMPGSGQAAAEHAVAILPGGLGGLPTDQAVQRSYSISAVDSQITPQSETRKYVPVDNTDNAARSLGGARSITIVRLDTGEVVRTLRFGQVPGTPQSADKQAPLGLYESNRITNAPFDAPIGGQLVSYPAGAGSVADRAYVGDAEGHLWRLNLSSSNPAEWSASMFFDAYPAGGLGLDGAYEWKSATPIETPPIVSTDLLGRVTVAFSTGEQEVVATDDRNFNIWSLTEKVSGTTFSSSVNWYLNHLNATDLKVAPDPPANCTSTSPVTPNKARFQPGERVLGPMSLFDGVLYFTTYDPNTLNPANCTAGYSYLWGVHYLNSGTVAYDKAEDVTAGGEPRWIADPGDPTALNTRYMVNCPGAVPFGASVSQQPSCVTTVPTPVPDSFLALGGTHFSMTSVSPGPFQVTVQTGQKVAGSQTNVSTYTVRTPPGGTIIDSWATVID
jgi:type IV pilus assembly protein PilY1